MILAFALAAGCLSAQGDRILGRDLAAAVPALASVPAEWQASFAPVPGRRRTFARAELAQIAARHGADAASLPDTGVCFEWPLRELAADEIEGAILALLPAGSEAKILDWSRFQIPNGRLVFQPRATEVWHGYVEYAPGKRVPVWAKVQAQVPFSRVVATRALRPGERIGTTDVRLEQGTGAFSPRVALASVDRAMGRVVRRLLADGQPVTECALGRMETVRRGDPVRVDVVEGAARISFGGIAESSGGVGEVVGIRNAASKRVVRARVVAPGVARIGGGA